MDNRFGFPRTAPPDGYAHLNRSTLDTGVAVIREMSAGMSLRGQPSTGKFNEKELMHGLNDRLAGFIEKVHQLERQNHLLEKEIEEIRGRAKAASCLEEEYGPELRRLRQLVQDISRQKHLIEVEHQNLECELSDLRRQHEREARGRSDAENNIVVLKRDISDAYQAKIQLDKKAQALVDEIHFLKGNHEAEVSEMYDQIRDAQVTVKAHDFGNPGVTAALRDIRAQLEGHSVCDLQQVGETFRSQFAKLTEAAETKREALKATQQEIQEHRRRLQAKSIELDCAKGTREALERQLHDVEDRHKEELIHYQNTIKELENELINCKFDMSGYLREYQDLLNVKMALDVEIMSYRKLLCGEEARLSTMSDTHISLPYIYHQSPVYTLPCLSRPGGPHRRAEPQYKFVEEIITETTREIEMSEFEETGSEETDEQESTKRDKGSSEEEKGTKDDREDDGEQMSDSEQNQVATGGNGTDEGSPGEVNDGDKGQKSEEEKEPEGGDDEEDQDIGKDTQSKAVMSESLDEDKQPKKAAADTNSEKEAAVTVVTDQKDLDPKADDVKPEVRAEEEEEEEKSGDGKKANTGKDSTVSAQAEKPVDETSAQEPKESEKTEELRSITQAQDQVQTLTSEKSEKAADVGAEAKGKDTGELSEKAEVSSSKPESEVKGSSHTEPKEISKSGAPKAEDKAVEGIQDAERDSDKGQDKESSLKSDEKSLPEVRDQKPNGEDKTKTVQTTSPAVSAEIKEVEGSQGSKPKPSEDSEKIKDPPGNVQKAEGSKAEK